MALSRVDLPDRRTNNGEEFAAFDHQVETIEDCSFAPLENTGNAVHFDSGRGTEPRRQV